MSGNDGVFEIREYLDSDGKIEKHDVRDISQELDYFAKLCADDGVPSALNEDDEFIRELALLSEDKEADHTWEKEYSDETQEEPALGKASAPPLHRPTGGSVSKNSGWGKGFLNAKTTKTATSTIQPAVKVANCTSSIEVKPDTPLSIEPNNAPLPPSSDFVASSGSTASAPASGSGSASVVQTAFSGSIVEKAPLQMTDVRKTSTGVLLGPKKKP